MQHTSIYHDFGLNSVVELSHKNEISCKNKATIVPHVHKTTIKMRAALDK